MVVRRCPKCKSEDLEYVPWLGQIWICKKCGYKGPVVVEEDD